MNICDKCGRATEEELHGVGETATWKFWKLCDGCYLNHLLRPRVKIEELVVDKTKTIDDLHDMFDDLSAQGRV